MVLLVPRTVHKHFRVSRRLRLNHDLGPARISFVNERTCSVKSMLVPTLQTGIVSLTRHPEASRSFCFILLHVNAADGHAGKRSGRPMPAKPCAILHARLCWMYIAV